jgi:superfamily II DNA or RNA helicase
MARKTTTGGDSIFRRLRADELDLGWVDSLIAGKAVPALAYRQLAERLFDARDYRRSRDLFKRFFQARPCVQAFWGVQESEMALRRPVEMLRWGLENRGRVPAPRSLQEHEWLDRAEYLMDFVSQELRKQGIRPEGLLQQPPAAPGRRRAPAGRTSPAAGARGAHPSARAKGTRKAGAAGAAPARQPSGAAAPLSRAAPAPALPALPLPELKSEVVVRFEPSELLSRLTRDELPAGPAAAERLALERVEDWKLTLLGQHLSLAASFDELLCLESVRGVETLRYQVETVRRVLRGHRGRALLADEVGLGKTIEAGLILKEYLLRGLVERFLVLCPPSLVAQWQSELAEKFDIPCVTSSDEAYRADPAAFWTENRAIVASLHTAKTGRNAAVLHGLELDLVIVDEAHHLKNRSTISWKFVDGLRRKFLLFLTATPVQNDLDELYNLITLLRPGTLGTPAQFRRDFVASGKRNVPRDPERLRSLMSSVMVRNTRAVADLRLPPRRAVTYHVQQSSAAAQLYTRLSTLLRQRYAAAAPSEKLVLHALLSRAGSSLVALAGTLERYEKSAALTGLQAQTVRELHRSARALAGQEAKLQRLLQLVGQGPGKKIVFTQYRDTLDFLERSLAAAGHRAAVFHGGLSVPERTRSVESFRQSLDVLLCTEAGSEGQNLQFARTVINYDLPWNPMRIEQRIGRVHRIGQTEPVHVFNLALAGSIESYVLEVLEQKINLFELVVGELGVILGNLTEDQDFPDRVLEIWLGARSEEEARQGFERLGQELEQARSSFEQSAALDEALFGRDFEA